MDCSIRITSLSFYSWTTQIHIESPFHSMPSAMLATPKTAWFRRPISGPISQGSYGSGDESIITLSSNHPAFLQQIFMLWQRKCHLQKVGDLHHLGSRVHGLFDVQVYNGRQRSQISLDWFCWENLNRKPMGFYHQIDRAFRLKFSHHPILWRLINLRAAKFWGVIGQFWRQPFLWVWHPKGWGMTPAACKSATTALFLDMFKYGNLYIYIYI